MPVPEHRAGSPAGREVRHPLDDQGVIHAERKFLRCLHGTRCGGPRVRLGAIARLREAPGTVSRCRVGGVMCDAPAKRTNRLRRSLIVMLFVLYGVGLTAIVLWPTTVSGSFDALLEGMNGALPNSAGLLEFAANVALFVPIGVLGGLLPKGWRWIGPAAGAALSMSAELVQAALLPQRVASVLDVVANVAGVLVGLVWAGLLGVGRRSDSSRQGTVIDSSSGDGLDGRGAV